MRGSSSSMWLWIAVTSMSPARRARMRGLTSLPVTRKVARDRGLATAGRLEVDRVGSPERGIYGHAAFHRGIPAGDAELVHAAGRVFPWRA